ncbi:hypothetical protein PNU83_01155 [Turicibacter sanguinis]|uniref:hypothetical protein n=1 Tax=Turicibacter sanguinis TaxID=154288 RepID=UPI0018AB13B6|nr:hypothetical protein [Turicibacter sanguinis]MDB8562703.1 hypothetical protein [Turicibacter sanguinis]
MKPLDILFLICELSLLSACSTPVPELVLLNTPGMPLKLTQIEFPTEEPQSTSVSLQNPSQMTLPNKEEEFDSPLLSDEEKPSNNEDNPSTHSIQPSLESPNQNTPSLYLENGVGRAYYETLPYLNSNDVITLNKGETDYATVQFDHYEIIDDHQKSGRKGIAFYYKETNISDQEIHVGLAGRVLDPVVNTSVFYGEDELKLMPADELNLKFADEDYLQTQHVEFTQQQAKVEACSTPNTLEPGKSRLCYNHYSYAGKGEYLINQALDNTYSNYQSFLIEVK